ncbi:ThiF family protein, putative [Oscillochloris trichoides DG-6]|uniref:ThiF family protein, putative n=1 Tax=Oscillochloris trichoides DG-6 TaxID=765420 RepID=E1IC73_9CHLR|nr:ThiF family adenylyltransferase [Oscillochloris trichoides]EFO81190.1 ThiF family protein, putative [Oscillochloris trichoides DG-6]
MFLTIPDTLVTQALIDTDRTEGQIYGRLLDGGDVAQVMGFSETSGSYLGCWRRIESSTAAPKHDLSYSEGEILLLIIPGPPETITAQRRTSDAWEEVECNIVRLHADYTSRLHGIFEADHLANKRVAVIGLGSGGSVVATQLARCGVGHMRLVDFDRLEVHNIARHVCGLHDIGRYKTRAMRDLLYDISPAIQVETFELNILDDLDALGAIVSDCDLVVAATDREESKVAINRACWPRGVAAVYGAAYNRAFGGDVFRAIPPDGACYDCFQAVVTEYFGPPPAATQDFSVGYEDPTRLPDLIAEPGLGIDVGMIALLMTRVALLTLLRGSNTTLPDVESNWLLFGNRAEWIFQKPLESLFIEVERQNDCPTCQYRNYVASNLDGMSVEEAATEAQEILGSLPSMPSPLHPHP